MQDVRTHAERWIALRILERWPHAQQAEEAAKNFDRVLCEYEVPVWKFLDLIAMWRRKQELTLDYVRAWAKQYAEERERVLERVPKL